MEMKNQFNQHQKEQSFNFQAFREILDEIDRQNHESQGSQLKKQVSFTKNKAGEQQKGQSRNIDQNRAGFGGVGKLNQESANALFYNNSSGFQTYLETVSTFDKNFTITETTSSKQIAATYMKLTITDLPLIIDAINNNTDLLRLFFGCKALRKILSTGNEYTIKEVIQNFDSLGKRLVHLLMMPQCQELQIEILWALVNLTSLKDNHKMQELIEFGLFEAVLSMVDEELNESLSGIDKSELALQVICNSIADQEKSKNELIMIEQTKGQMRFSIKDKIDMMMEQVEIRCNESDEVESLDKYEELIFQISMILESYMHSYKILSKKMFRWIVITTLKIFTLQSSQRNIDSALVTLKQGSQHNEYANHIIYKHSQRKQIAQKLIALAQNMDTYEIAYNSLLILGNLASSDYFKEQYLVTEGNIYQAFTNLLSNTYTDQMENQYLHIMLWTLSNIIADDETCQTILISSWSQLIIKTLQVGLQSQSIKVIREAQVIFDNILDIENSGAYLFANDQVYPQMIDNLAFPLSFQDHSVQLTALKTFRTLLNLNPELVQSYTISPMAEHNTFTVLLQLQYSPYQEVYDLATYLIKKYFQRYQEASDLFHSDTTTMTNSTTKLFENQSSFISYSHGNHQKKQSETNVLTGLQRSFTNIMNAQSREYIIMVIDDE